LIVVSESDSDLDGGGYLLPIGRRTRWLGERIPANSSSEQTLATIAGCLELASTLTHVAA
jgi:hypothetical protein